MAPLKTFIEFSIQAGTLQSMIKFDNNPHTDNTLAECVILGLPANLRGKANEWELLDATTFDFQYFEKRIMPLNKILNEQNPSHSSCAGSPKLIPTSSPNEITWRVHAFLDLQGRWLYCKTTCGSLYQVSFSTEREQSATNYKD
ncbi:hypothetical protein PSTT_08014 [Puccinia striiformis]|uniref:Uncharacterized protein n=2 Tax=Puccinia striiformis TaxID=27350 RepID=A0A0L0UWT2_9BASI|nr:hypothetical protein PSTG_15090 [Puccinia striiformis f. sp. tritici PST-78]POW07807.1 hypothetical protein PSTT_08014 [Puccinia striiformis]